LTFRIKLLLAFTLAVFLAVAVVASTISTSMRHAFERLDRQRTAALVAQFQREFERQREEVTRRIAAIAGTDFMVQMAVELNRPQPDYSSYVRTARELAGGQRLDFLQLIAGDGTIISSAQWPARFGYKEEWVTQPVDWASQGAFLNREELPEGSALALEAVRPVRIGRRGLHVVGGMRLDQQFLRSLALPAGMRAMLYANSESGFSPQALISADGTVAFPLGKNPEKLAPLIERVRRDHRELSQIITWGQPQELEFFHALPLLGRGNNLLGVLLVGSSEQELAMLERRIRLIALQVGGGGMLLGFLLSIWAAARVTRPVERLAAAAREVAEGNWEARVEAGSTDEIGQLAKAFNRMTEELVEQRERLVQAERVAAWRELARRLAHELKNPLFPLQITVENLLRAHDQQPAKGESELLNPKPASAAKSPAQFEEVFRESTSTLLAELANLKMIIGRFSDFARMPPPQLQPVHLNEIVRAAVRLFEAQFTVPGRPPITTTLNLDAGLDTIQADPELLHRAVQNLVLNAMDAMPSGGKLTVRTRRIEGTPASARIEISDSGLGLTKEECERLFTPYYTTKRHGTGLGLAIVQSVVSDHGGKISVESEQGRGTTFLIDLPADANRDSGPGGGSSEESDR
jgi:two-component system, NtrC family, nitrogen regulation sensor histidine kinase NtrY